MFQNYPNIAIHLEDESGPVTIAGNHIGVDVTGTVPVGGTYGIFATSGNHVIGGVSPADRNVISGNTYGMWLIGGNTNVVKNFIGTDATGTSAIPNDLGVNARAGNHIGRAFLGNVISGNIEGVAVTSDCTVRGNLIGTDATGTAVLENTDVALSLHLRDNRIGGLFPGQGNVIAGGEYGIKVFHGESTITGNFLGTDITGTITDTDGLPLTHDFGFEEAAILVLGPSNRIGGKLPGESNVIAGSNHGIRLDGSDGNAHSNIIQGNFIGTDRRGTLDLGNTLDGIYVLGSWNNLIGGLSRHASNTIAFNDSGVEVRGQAANGNAILRNSIYRNNRGIYLIGTSANDPLDADSGANMQQNHPILTSAITTGTTLEVTGDLDSSPNMDYYVEFFGVLQCANGDGEGRFYLGAMFLSTDANGHASIVKTLNIPNTPAGAVVTSVATEIAGRNSSMFSPCMTVTQ